METEIETKTDTETDTLNNLDRIFVISLKTSTNRQNEFKKNFPELVSLNIFEWFFVEKDSTNAERGCYTSHKNVLELSKKKGYKTILVMEDDVIPLVSWKKFVSEFNNLKRPKNWKIIQFGYIPIKTTKTTDKKLYALNCGYFAEAYLVNVSQLDIPDYNGSQIDCLLFCSGHSHVDIIVNPKLAESLSKDIYVYNPRMFQQKFNDSDIGHDNSPITAFYNFYEFFGDVAHLSSHINLLLLIFLLVFFGIIVLVCITLFAFFYRIKSKKCYIKYISICGVIICIVYLLSMGITWFKNGKNIIELEY